MLGFFWEVPYAALCLVDSRSLLKLGHYSTCSLFPAVTCSLSASPEVHKKQDFHVPLVSGSHLFRDFAFYSRIQCCPTVDTRSRVSLWGLPNFTHFFWWRHLGCHCGGQWCHESLRILLGVL